jgi:hypothetical protein
MRLLAAYDRQFQSDALGLALSACGHSILSVDSLELAADLQQSATHMVLNRIAPTKQWPDICTLSNQRQQGPFGGIETPRPNVDRMLPRLA